MKHNFRRLWFGHRKRIEVVDEIVDDGKEKRVLDKKETTLAMQKQDIMRETFKDWGFRDPDRRQDLAVKYNKLFNSTRPREYDGSHLKFPRITPDIELKPHQKMWSHMSCMGTIPCWHTVPEWGKTFEITTMTFTCIWFFPLTSNLGNQAGCRMKAVAWALLSQREKVLDGIAYQC